MPMPGDETTKLLLESVLKKALEEVNLDGVELTAILLPGDFVRHGLAGNDFTVPNPKWPEMLLTI